MNPAPLTIDVRGIAEATGKLQSIRNGIANRRPLHATLVVKAQQLTSDYVSKSNRHDSAQRLGATPSGFRERAARRIKGVSDDTAAIVRIPRNTGLGRAFGDVTLRPGTGRTYLTIPACAETYGKVVTDSCFPAGSFAFATLGGRYPALLWAESGGSHEKGKVAYWLRREVVQRQDRALLPSDAGYTALASEEAKTYIASLIYRAP
jgi:hypothetical protein